MSYQPGRFQIDGLAGPFDGYTDGQTWNGWACPVFERHEAERIADSFRTQGERHGFPGPYEVRFDHDADAFFFCDPDDDPADGPLAFESSTIDADGKPVRVYFVGTHYWTWEAV